MWKEESQLNAAVATATIAAAFIISVQNALASTGASSQAQPHPGAVCGFSCLPRHFIIIVIVVVIRFL